MCVDDGMQMSGFVLPKGRTDPDSICNKLIRFVVVQEHL